MKKLLFTIALLFFLSLKMFAQLIDPSDTTGTLITAAIRPNSQADDIATVYTNETRGGLHNYQSLSDLQTIKPSRLVPWMLATIADQTGVLYQYNGTAWNPLDIGSGGNSSGLEKIGNSWRLFGETPILLDNYVHLPSIEVSGGISFLNDKNKVALGLDALESNTTGLYNVGVGNSAGASNINGGYNVFIGKDAGKLTKPGGTNTTSNHGVYIGQGTRALATGQMNQIVIGSSAVGAGSYTATLGDDNITDVYFGEGNAVCHLEGIYFGDGTYLDSKPEVETDSFREVSNVSALVVDFVSDDVIDLTCNSLGGVIDISVYNDSPDSSKEIVIYVNCTTPTSITWDQNLLTDWIGETIKVNFAASERGLLRIRNFGSGKFVCSWERTFIEI